jgi:hypothetical protein
MKTLKETKDKLISIEEDYNELYYICKSINNNLNYIEKTMQRLNELNKDVIKNDLINQLNKDVINQLK